MGRSAKALTRKGNGAEPDSGRELDLTSLRQTPGFMIRILQLENFEAFYPHFEALKLSPVEYAILVTLRDNRAVTQSELAAVLKMQLPNLVKILARMEETGTIRRKRSARDKRAVELSLSAAGQRRAGEASRLGIAFNAPTPAPLAPPGRLRFLPIVAPVVGGSPPPPRRRAETTPHRPSR